MEGRLVAGNADAAVFRMMNGFAARPDPSLEAATNSMAACHAMPSRAPHLRR